jgi:hypothetical protein
MTKNNVKNVVTTLSPEEHLDLKIKAAKADRSIAEILRGLIRGWLGKGEENSKKSE